MLQGSSTRCYTFVKLETLSAELKTLGANKIAKRLPVLLDKQLHLKDQVDTELNKFAADKGVTELPALLEQKLHFKEQGEVEASCVLN